MNSAALEKEEESKERETRREVYYPEEDQEEQLEDPRKGNEIGREKGERAAYK